MSRMYRLKRIEASERDINVSEDVDCVAWKLNGVALTAEAGSVGGLQSYARLLNV